MGWHATHSRKPKDTSLEESRKAWERSRTGEGHVEDSVGVGVDGITPDRGDRVPGRAAGRVVHGRVLQHALAGAKHLDAVLVRQQQDRLHLVVLCALPKQAVRPRQQTQLVAGSWAGTSM